ncbi:MAG: histidine phosphatase family protein [Actinomycetota bacterium]
MPTDFIIVRHGDPGAGGVEDPPLSELGRQQATATAEMLGAETIDAVYVSPLRRARESAGPIGDRLGVTPIVEDRIAEFDHGQVYYSEKHAAELSAEVAMAKLAAMQSPEFQGRVLAGFDAIEAANPDRTVAVVCHGGVISAIVGAAVYNPSLVFLPAYGSITRVRSHTGGLRNLVSYNESSWLPALAD